MATPGPRRRRSAADSRRRILEAARRRLAEEGPEGLRLQDLARDLDLSHPAILHHFGSREGLLRALAAHCAEGLNEALAERLSAEEPDLEGLLEQTAATFGAEGHARLLAWLALSGHRDGAGGPAPGVLGDVARRAHAVRQARRREQGLSPIPYEDTLHTVLLAATSLFGEALLGDLLRRSAGLEDPEAPRRFRAWLAGMIREHAGRSEDVASNSENEI